MSKERAERIRNYRLIQTHITENERLKRVVLMAARGDPGFVKEAHDTLKDLYGLSDPLPDPNKDE